MLELMIYTNYLKNLFMIKDFLRWMATILSFPNNLRTVSSSAKDVYLQNFLFKKTLGSFSINNKEKTHIIFSNKILEIVKNKRLTNFLRYSFIQKIFFVHNRFFIYKELLELKKDIKNWNLWKKLLVENNIGNPVNYFLYKDSSGNRIRQVYHLKKFIDFANLDLKKIKYVFEIGGGYGCMASIFYKINPKIKYVIFDTKEVNLIQYYYLKMNNIPASLNSSPNNTGVNLISNIDDIKLTKKLKCLSKNKAIIIANWSLSEMPIILRKKLNFIYKVFNFILISFQDKFENINNLNYFRKIQKNLNKTKYKSNIYDINTMNSNLFSKRKNFYLFINNLGC